MRKLSKSPHRVRSSFGHKNSALRLSQTPRPIIRAALVAVEISTGLARPVLDEEKLGSWPSSTPGTRFNTGRAARCRLACVAGRDAHRRGNLVAEPPGFVPLRIVPNCSNAGARGSGRTSIDPESEADNRIEIVLPDCTGVGPPRNPPAVLRRVLARCRMIPVPVCVRVWLAVGNGLRGHETWRCRCSALAVTPCAISTPFVSPRGL